MWLVGSISMALVYFSKAPCHFSSFISLLPSSFKDMASSAVILSLTCCVVLCCVRESLYSMCICTYTTISFLCCVVLCRV